MRQNGSLTRGYAMGEVIDLKLVSSTGKTTAELLGQAGTANFRKAIVIGQSTEGSLMVTCNITDVAELLLILELARHVILNDTISGRTS